MTSAIESGMSLGSGGRVDKGREQDEDEDEDRTSLSHRSTGKAAGTASLWHSRRERLCCYHERAKCRQVLARHRAAAADFTRVISMEPRNAHALLRRGLSFRVLRDFERAACDFEGAKSAAPSDPNVTVSYAARDVEAVLLCAAGEEPFFGPAEPMPL